MYRPRPAQRSRAGRRRSATPAACATRAVVVLEEQSGLRSPCPAPVRSRAGTFHVKRPSPRANGRGAGGPEPRLFLEDDDGASRAGGRRRASSSPCPGPLGWPRAIHWQARDLIALLVWMTRAWRSARALYCGGDARYAASRVRYAGTGLAYRAQSSMRFPEGSMHHRQAGEATPALGISGRYGLPWAAGSSCTRLAD